MFIDRISINRFRTFRKAEVPFLHRDQNFEALGIPEPKLPNVNLLLGNNGVGKTTLLKAIAIAALGPAVSDVNLPIYRLVRREAEKKGKAREKAKAGKKSNVEQKDEAVIEATFCTHEQDIKDAGLYVGPLESHVTITRMDDLERVRWTRPEEKGWDPIFSAKSDAFFFVGYGSTRRVESQDRLDLGARLSSSFARAQRIRSLFEDAYSLVPLSAWLPKLGNKGRTVQVHNLINKLLAHTGYTFTGEQELGEYLFERDGLKVPFPALSDGYRAYLGWIGDLLFHVTETCPSGKKLTENRGVVMVDEIDLHLHPKWQMTVLPTLAAELPNIQFIVTSHSPLIVGSLEWMNILFMEPGPGLSAVPKRIPSPVHGLDADQVLLTEFFGLESTRTSDKSRRLKRLTVEARDGDPDAALQLLAEMSRGSEGSGETIAQNEG